VGRYVAVGIGLEDFFEILVDLGAVVELSPEEGGGEEFLFGG
jgi:hypothetical protein